MIAWLVWVGVAQACGPRFSVRLLEDRAQSLLELPEGSFVYEAARLVPPPADDLVVQLGTGDQDRALAERVGLSDSQALRISGMRSAKTLALAREVGAGLPSELFRYTLGAAALQQGDRGEALRQFDAVRAMSPSQRRLRGAWAAYSAARLLGHDEALEAYAEVRASVRSGALDPWGLAVASLGEEARRHWWRGEIERAVALYAEQAAHGSTSGAASLLRVARSLASEPERIGAWIDDPLVARMMIAYAWTRTEEMSRHGLSPEALIEALEAGGGAPVEGSDRVAALAYERGAYDLAERYAARSSSPLSTWIQAKLALRRGDLAAAADAYAIAARAFPEGEVWGKDGGTSILREVWCRVDREQGLLSLARGDYVQALRILYGATSSAEAHPQDLEGWTDAAYVAERVLTVDELVAFVDAEVPRAPVAKAIALRALLARRLVRAGRPADALRYFDDPELHQAAEAYAVALDRTERGHPVERARAWLEAARLARPGLYLLGTEGAPDHVVLEGLYDGGALQIPERFADPLEAGRVAASAPAHEIRFHYRQIAADHAVAAADLLPPSSQAFGVALCEAATFVRNRDPQRRDALYRRYLQEGPLYEGSGDFGSACPPPDWGGARELIDASRWGQLRIWLPRIFVLILIPALIGWARRRRS